MLRESGDNDRSETDFVKAWYRQLHEEIVAVTRTHMPKWFNVELSQFAFLKMLYARAYVMEALPGDGRLTRQFRGLTKA